MNIAVQAASHHYHVTIGHRILSKALLEQKVIFDKADKVIVLTDKKVWEAQSSYFTMNISYPFEVFVMPPGEKCKSFDNYSAVQTFLLEQKCTRQSLILAFGGGAVGDVAGFVAATYMRGIPFIQIPTTILAHDSAVGGKTAINHPLGKNMIGAFYQPQAVIYDTALLASLPKREVLSGMAEVVKHALISDITWLEQLLEGPFLTQLTDEELASHLASGIRVKAKIVSEDETEQSVRKYLNLGHTYGHAIEAAAGYGGLAHGEAVMIGLVYSLLLSERYGTITREFTDQFLRFAVDNGYPFEAVNEYSFEQLSTYLLKDKKVMYGELKFIVLEEIGKPYVQTVSLEECQEVDAAFRTLLTEVLV